MADTNRKISRINLNGDYSIDVASELKDATPTHDSQNVVTSDGIAKALDLKLEKKPDGSNELINEDGKINMTYLSNSALGQVKFGGIFSSGVITQTSAILKDFIAQEFRAQYPNLEFSTSSFAGSDPELAYENGKAYLRWYEGYSLNGYIDINVEGFYFIASTDCTFAEINFATGDWLLASGGKWAKVDNTDAVKQGDNELITVNSAGTITTNIIHKGTADNSFEVFDGEALGKNSVAMGTAEIPSDFKSLAGSFTAKAPVASAEASLAAGTSSKAISTGAIAFGVTNQAGITGYYWHTIDFTNKTITLSTTRPTTFSTGISAPTNAIDWTVGDYICIVNNNKYPFATTITNISGNTITVDALPFTTDNYSSNLATYPLTYTAPDDRTIFAVSRTYNTTTQRSTITPRTGAVEMGWAAAVFGAMNIGAGTFSQAFGWQNIAAGDFGLIAGRDNVGGYASVTGGWNNTNITDCSTVFGKGNQALRNPTVGETNGGNLITGNGNITSAWNAAAIGRQLRATTNAQLVAGQFNKVTDERATFVVGNGNVTNDTIQDGDEVLDGLKVARSNAFTVYHSGRIEAGKSTTTSDSAKTLVTLDLIKGTGANVGSNVFNLGKDNKYEYFEGSSVNSTTNSAESLIVGNGNIAHGNQILIAGYNNKVGVNQGIALGEGNTVTGAQGFAANANNIVTGSSGAAFGESNTVNGQNSVAFGLRNKVLVATGVSNSGKNHIISGEDNTSSNWNNAVFGRFLDADTSALTVVGQFNKTPSERAMFIVGNGNVDISGVTKTTTTNQTTTAYSRRNAFVAYYDGRCAAGAHPRDDYDLVTKYYFENNATKVDWDNITEPVHIKNTLEVDSDLALHGDLNIDGALGFGYLKGTTVEVDYLKVAAEPEEDTDVVNKAYFDSHSSNVDLSNYTGDVNIDGNVAITGDLSFDGDIEFASIDAQSIKVNGKNVLVEGDTTGGSLSIDSFDSTYFTTNDAGKITLNMNALLAQEW